MSDDRLYNIALGLLPGVGAMLARQFLAYGLQPGQVFTHTAAQLMKVPGIGQGTAQKIVEQRTAVLKDAEKVLTKLQKTGDQVLFLTDPDYPVRLRQIEDAPLLLYKRGTADLDAKHAIAIVGTRRATTYGQAVTDKLVGELKQYNALIVSGLAYGIDIMAHRASLREGLPTVGVMANGFDRLYPKQHEKTAKAMLEQGGAWLSEHIYDVEAETFHFPARNRIIAGLAEAVIVVEAGPKGGALITAELANGYNREVLAVPGDLTRESSSGCNRLIKENKAICYTRIEDLVEALNWDLEQAKEQKAAQLALFQSQLSDEENTVLGYLATHADVHIDELSRNTLISINKLASLLLQLEFSGLVRSLPGKKFCYAK